MGSLNPNALLLIAFSACVGALLGTWLIGLTVGLGICLAITIASIGGR
jgi:hypothetical protein